jgi:hypothetical protein
MSDKLRQLHKKQALYFDAQNMLDSLEAALEHLDATAPTLGLTSDELAVCQAAHVNVSKSVSVLIKRIESLDLDCEELESAIQAVDLSKTPETTLVNHACSDSITNDRACSIKTQIRKIAGNQLGDICDVMFIQSRPEPDRFVGDSESEIFLFAPVPFFDYDNHKEDYSDAIELANKIFLDGILDN